MTDIRISSGRSKIYIYDTHVIKVYSYPVDTKYEYEIIKTINSDFLVKILDITPNSVTYERVVPLTSLEKFISRDTETFITLLSCISCAIFDIHKFGYVHKDIARGNIGLNKAGYFVLYDTEDLSVGNEEKMYEDVMMFLDDMKIWYRENTKVIKILELLYLMMDKHTTITQKTIMIMNKHKIRDYKIITYKAEDFPSYVSQICNNLQDYL